VTIAGIDLIRDGQGNFRVLEDNLRTPSGVSYVLENRAILGRLLPALFERVAVRSVEEYPYQLRNAVTTMLDVDGISVVLTPGPYNSAYFEHAFLARRMGLPLAIGSDLLVKDDMVYLRTTQGLARVSSIYRRIDDDFLDPETFRDDSMLGTPGLFRAYKAGNVALANAIGNSVADNKAVYPYVPKMIKYYLDQDPILGQVETYTCAEKEDLAYVLANLEKLVVKEVDGAGGYGMLVGPTATKEERDTFAKVLQAKANRYIAQPLVELSTCPTCHEDTVAPRRVDLRPFIVSSKKGRWVLPGGLTRVALVPGSYVVNSSQGGGSKDTWVIQEERP
ncbi:MAG: circularly permuted type 2 ATP-grasp protein, partial [Myxococcales bacterium]|nr:circularly permuted type 2 ATP-grasp protein [Myxococcales bacterium]